MLRNSLFLILVALFIAGCASPSNKQTSDGRYSMKQDKAPTAAPDLSQVQDAQPKYEPYSAQGNKDYEVWGKSYQVMPEAAGYTETGTASWYGMKFHGHLTSNGETYDMYAMSGAHKTLPLPSYVRVTNLNNNKSVVVRINDRGPFHSSRIIDLSYAAAYKLGMLATGTAPVKLEVIMMDSPAKRALDDATPTSAAFYIQVFASSSKEKVQQLTHEFERKFSLKSRINEDNHIFKLQLGPISNEDVAGKMLDTIRSQGYGKSFLIREE